MALHKSRCGLICGEVPDLPESQGQALEISRKNGAVGYPHLKMGRDHNGFHHEVTADITGGGFNLSQCGSTKQECAFYPYLREYPGREIGRHLHPRGGDVSWEVGYSTALQHDFSPIDC